MTREQAQNAIVTAVPPEFRRTAVAYIAEGSCAAGEVLSLDRQDYTCRQPMFLGFIDLDSGRNWGHACLYVLCHQSGGVETRPGMFPPALTGDRRLVAISAGEAAPDWAIARR